jgi:pyruvate/2-oxoglutarate dehydrogenase complex dihydrolipoamide acyltransferase (E2) component
VDFYSPDDRQWWQDRLARAITEEKIAEVLADFGEELDPGAVLADGSSGAARQNTYGSRYAHAVADAGEQPEEMISSRCAGPEPLGGNGSRRPKSTPTSTPASPTPAPRATTVKQVKCAGCGFRNTENSARRILFQCTGKQRAATQFSSLPGQNRRRHMGPVGVVLHVGRGSVDLNVAG